MNLPWIARRKKPVVLAPWGQFRARERDLKGLAASGPWSAPGAAADHRWIDNRTWDDLNLDDVFTVLDRTESTIGQQALYGRLRRACGETQLPAFEALVSRFSADAAARDAARLTLARLGDSTDPRGVASAARELRALHGSDSAALTAHLASDRAADPGALVPAVGEIDAALSVASYRAETPDWVRPVFAHGASPAKMVEIRHPLIADAVPNTISICPPHGVIITGSNMSGKSTFLRTVGVTAVMAQSINMCLADAYECPRLAIRSCIGRADDPATGRSYYLMEVDAVLSLVKAARSDMTHLMLFDELFRGTNAIERIAAGEAVLAALVPLDGARHIVIAATHDDELVDLLAGRYEAHHFTDHVESAGVAFDYKIRPGSATTRNAIALLKMRGAPDELVEYALVRATRLERARQSAE